MFRSLHRKLVLILVLLIVSVMAVSDQQYQHLLSEQLL